MAARGAGPGGRLLRFVVGSDRLPELPFLAPDAPGWRHDDAVELSRDGPRFALYDDGTAVLAGAVGTTPFGLTVDVGAAQVLGFGAATGRADRNGQQFRVMTRDTLFYGIPGASYTALPFFIARRGRHALGVLVATTLPLDVDVGEGKVSITGACESHADPVDVVVFSGSMMEVVRDLAALVGRTFLPPAWALGFHQSRWSYRTQEVVLRIASRFRELGLPADVIHLDIHYMDRYRVFTFSPQRFPQPRRMHDELHALGFRTLAIVDPGVAVAPTPAYEQLRSGGMLLQRADGSEYHGRVWPGTTVFPDFSQPAARLEWGKLHAPLIEAGVAGFWNDMNDPVFQVGRTYDPLAEDVYHHGVPHRRVRNLYANGMAEATVSGLERLRPDARPFVLSRSGFLGIQRHSAVWTGDNHSSWEHLRENLNMVLNLGLSGIPLSGADVRGFGRGPGRFGAIKPLRPSAELFVRWMELGALMPFFRVHCTLYAPSQEPWSFGRRALALSRRVLRRRYRWLPLLYRLALEAHTDGLPIVRPLWMHFDVPDGKGTDQFLLGEHVLAAPVLDRGEATRAVWLPRGCWTDWNSGEVLEGGRDHVVDAPLGTTPLFVLAGAALFQADPARNALETLRMPLALEVAPPPPGCSGRGSLFLDDGESARSARYVTDVSVEWLTEHLVIRFRQLESTFEPVQRHLELRVPLDFTHALVDGERRDLTFRNLAHEDRRAVMMALRAPLDVHEIVLRWD